MLIFDENNQTILLDSIYSPVKSEYFWCLDTDDKDFCIAPLNILEEITAPTFTINLDGFSFDVPASWNVLIYDAETMQIDSVELGNAAGKDFSAFVYGPVQNHHSGQKIVITGYKPVSKSVAPLLNKHQMLCHPISPIHWVCITPHDVQKHLKHVYVGNLLNFI